MTHNTNLAQQWHGLFLPGASRSGNTTVPGPASASESAPRPVSSAPAAPANPMTPPASQVGNAAPASRTPQEPGVPLSAPTPSGLDSSDPASSHSPVTQPGTTNGASTQPTATPAHEAPAPVPDTNGPSQTISGMAGAPNPIRVLYSRPEQVSQMDNPSSDDKPQRKLPDIIPGFKACPFDLREYLSFSCIEHGLCRPCAGWLHGWHWPIDGIPMSGLAHPQNGAFFLSCIPQSGLLPSALGVGRFCLPSEWAATVCPQSGPLLSALRVGCHCLPLDRAVANAPLDRVTPSLEEVAL